MKDNKDFEAFESKYQKEEKEILILTSCVNGTAQIGNSWRASKYFLAYVDMITNELKKGEGCVDWLISKEENMEHGFKWPYCFRDGVIYRLKVRELIDKTVPEGGIPFDYNRFMIVEVLEENVHNDALLAILEEYKKPVKIFDKDLGEFELDKAMEAFEGTIEWLGEEVHVSLDVDVVDEGSWTKAMHVLRTLFEQQKQKDAEFRAFAAEELTGLANEWLEDENAAAITKQDFMNRISLTELAVDLNGEYTAYYDDDAMFLYHAITVYGDLKNGINSASIEG